MDKNLQTIFDHILEGNATETQKSVKSAIDAHLDPAIILNDGMIAAMTKVGSLFEEGEYFVPEMLIAARAMQSGLAILRPYLQEADVKSTGKVVIGTVKGDLHDIGKNLVAMMLEGAGFDVIDLGTDVSPEKFIEVVQTSKADIVALSALLTTTMPNMKTIIDAFEIADLRDQVKVIIGGAPVTDNYAQQIGADGYSPDASRAVVLAKSLVSSK